MLAPLGCEWSPNEVAEEETGVGGVARGEAACEPGAPLAATPACSTLLLLLPRSRRDMGWPISLPRELDLEEQTYLEHSAERPPQTIL